jgi:hypothetical protein
VVSTCCCTIYVCHCKESNHLPQQRLHRLYSVKYVPIISLNMNHNEKFESKSMRYVLNYGQICVAWVILFRNFIKFYFIAIAN